MRIEPGLGMRDIITVRGDAPRACVQPQTCTACETLRHYCAVIDLRSRRHKGGLSAPMRTGPVLEPMPTGAGLQVSGGFGTRPPLLRCHWEETNNRTDRKCRVPVVFSERYSNRISTLESTAVMTTTSCVQNHEKVNVTDATALPLPPPSLPEEGDWSYCVCSSGEGSPLDRSPAVAAVVPQDNLSRVGAPHHQVRVKPGKSHRHYRRLRREETESCTAKVKPGRSVYEAGKLGRRGTSEDGRSDGTKLGIVSRSDIKTPAATGALTAACLMTSAPPPSLPPSQTPPLLSFGSSSSSSSSHMGSTHASDGLRWPRAEEPSAFRSYNV